MTKEQSFRIGFAKRLAELGVEPSQLVKLSQVKFDLMKALEAAGKLGWKGLLGIASVPPMLGAGLGYGLEASRIVSPEDLKAMREAAMLQEYQYAIDQLEKEKKRESGRKLAKA